MHSYTADWKDTSVKISGYIVLMELPPPVITATFLGPIAILRYFQAVCGLSLVLATVLFGASGVSEKSLLLFLSIEF